jgi:hypothetical protein
MKYASVSNQWGFGIGYRHCKIYSAARHLIWLNIGYKSISWAWCINPKREVL